MQSWLQMGDASRYGPVPALYSGRIRYRREPAGIENWQSARETALLGYGDCEDLVAYRVAELRRQGVKAWPKVVPINARLRHVLVVYRDPRTGAEVTEDPSKKLGM
jgi:transglutaminase-like putative cysteine protease